ncbi:EAL domain-containing response regulator [Sphingomonas glaciei]|uniref:EAL domain-containing response regulator n=1 Tax=Sphingomonas glaciei TaxID=2938948 RepID=A0ABY5MV55_9SPHN|nr:EAL domain-containing response regulator [Sphingomonas glaciei]UUR08364.1 EAL domain-containing response regulator [Sphingomonas glaciei]
MSGPLVHLLEDDEPSGKLLQQSLRQRGYETCWTPRVRDLKIDPNRSNVVVLDLAMPEIDGFGAIDRIAKDRNVARVIIASGQQPRVINAALMTAQSAGLTVVGTLQKPYTARRLIELLETRFAPYQDPERRGEDWVKERLAEGSLADRTTVHFQPKHSLATKSLVGFEALARAADGSPISPDLLFGDLVPIDTTLAITCRVIQQSVAAIRRFEHQPMTIAFNCRAEVLCHPLFLPQLEAQVSAAGIDRSCLTVELTEHPTLEGLQPLSRAASQLTMLGYNFAVDDFGKGNAGFELLMQLPFTELKIDKDFFWSVLEGGAAMQMLREVIGYCRAQGILTTIEGIESDAQQEFATALGADLGQGFLWGRAAPL